MKTKFHTYWITISIGIMLFILTLPPIFQMTTEFLYSTYVHHRYEIKNNYAQILADQGAEDPYHPYETTPFVYGENEIDIMIVPKKKLSPTIFAGDVDIYLNGKFLGIIWNRVLKSQNAETSEEPATFDPTSADDVFVYVLRDRYTKKEDIIIFANITGYQMKAGEDYYHRYYPKEIEEMTRFQYWTIHNDGTYEKNSFSLKGSRTYLQTFLAQNGGIPIGQYSSKLYAYPVFFFPITYPILPAIIGVIFFIIGIKSRKKYMNVTSSVDRL
ncbi:hypothetical protein [Shimazuella kribbensis]|uniref:hypothetical protein n=1 Tax=Shimazuella kribbensis TaxID=139808 RepID=UPI00041A6BE5|nr:hypothetical protein [Shimazuella kribbensis]